MFASIFAVSLLFSIPIATVAQTQSPTVLCIPGQCLQGYSNTTIGAKLSAQGAPTSVQLLPGPYTSSTSPQLLHDILTSSSASLASSPGFQNSSSSVTLPLNLALQPGLSIFSDSLYSGQAAFTALPSDPVGNTTTPLAARSIALSSSVWATVQAGSNRVVFWDSVPDISQLPSSAVGNLALADIQSTACTPSCASSGICTSNGTCKCATGFTGSSCESCAAGFFGPSCQACPSDCGSCDEGITGSGRCLKPVVANAPDSCNCLNGVCSSGGQCTCNTGFVTADNGTQCAKCASGFFLTSNGDCQICQIGCTQCADTSGACLVCKTGFSQDSSDRTKCDPPQSQSSDGQACPANTFGDGTNCSNCDPACETCSGPASTDCIQCASGTYLNNGVCVKAGANGVCEGTKLIADNVKRECDTCGAKCTSCGIPGFGVGSRVNQLQCTGCLPGFVLSNGKCVDSCPSGSTVSTKDNLTCETCDSSCSTCAGSTTFCLSCPNNQLASNGKCISSCPSGTFTSSGSCLSCHPDCASCSGGAFNQCSSCPPSRPVLVNGRCLPTCSKSQYFDPTTSTCQNCDSSCSSCSGPGQNNCLACSSSTQVLRGGSCASSNCKDGATVIAGLGVCLSELVIVPQPSGTTTLPPLPSVTGLTTPTQSSAKRSLEWWQILLMALGCAFIFLAFIWCCRRRQRKQRAKRTEMFAQGAVATQGKSSWRWRLLRFGEKLFGHNRSRKIQVVVPRRQESEAYKLTKLRSAEEARPQRVEEEEGEEDIVQLIGSYQYARPPTPPSRNQMQYQYRTEQQREAAGLHRSVSNASQMSAPSIYSQMTGMPRRVPDPRQPLKKDLTSRFSSSTLSSDHHLRPPVENGKNSFWK
ncbi:TNFR/NGFR cysteine-rich region family protein [Crucibulum laeve]|uniref:TNFR/NGFR cysteine-rich region family protein n=1 Tax=Crucibulum laeve TaxID=68775 RepID=A0A5C3M8N7_9AGAR|nr:TNFR/NGFR cysteine-rich region family protein [Crucibulum laeve]